jgi:hypothetical protein
MQRNEIIIEQFVKTINESQLDVKGDAAMLNRIFEERDKRKKRGNLFKFFGVAAVVLIGGSFIVWGITGLNQIKETKKLVGPSQQLALMVPEYADPSDNVIEQTDVVVKAKVNKTTANKNTNHTTTKQEDKDFANVVTYKFNNHQVEVFKQGEEEFIQINVFGADGIEQDVLKIMEDLKKSYKNNEVYVDSVKHK